MLFDSYIWNAISPEGWTRLNTSEMELPVLDALNVVATAGNGFENLRF